MAEELYSATSNSVCEWFDSRTGVYKSKYKSINLPKSQFLDVVSFIFSFKHNGSSALIHPSSGYSLSYSNLHQMVNSFASGLHQLGVSKGDVVLILLPNTIYFPIIFLGVLSIGAIAMPMNPLSSSIEIDKRVKDCNVTLIFTENVEKVEHLNVDARVIRVPLVENIVECELQTSEFDCFNKLVSSNPRTWTRPEINQEDTATILYSSGTSGASKGVVLTHKNLISVIEVFVRFEALQSNSIYPVLENVYLAMVPMFHVYGLSLFALGLLSLGSTIVVMRNYDIEEMLRTIDTYGVTHLPIVPPILMDLTRAKSKGRCLLKSVKQVSFGAAPSSRKVIQDFAQGFPHVDLIQGYGMTESTAVGTRGLNTAKFRKYTSVGLLQPNLQAKVVDLESGLCLPPGLSGELRLKGPGIMKGYLNDANETRAAIDENGWLHTGDIVYFDQDGYLYIVDRLKEMIKYKGYQIAPADLESIILSHPDILDAAVTGCRDEEAGEIPVAYVVKKPGRVLSEKDVINYVSYQVAPCKKVRKVLFINCIPKSPAGKILRRQLRNSLVSRI